ncbi:hypothetical protein AKO1_006478 [Acrasis kona]|uniref:Uncharacterized protein n=1 Tax=Acrasis kona TaxID=1008807 RepID=A0AAW2YIW7_9EUKA
MLACRVARRQWHMEPQNAGAEKYVTHHVIMVFQGLFEFLENGDTSFCLDRTKINMDYPKFEITNSIDDTRGYVDSGTNRNQKRRKL